MSHNGEHIETEATFFCSVMRPTGPVDLPWALASTVRCVPLRYVDPHKKRGRLYRANVRFGRSRAGQFIARHVARHTDPYLFRLTGGRVNMGAIINAPLVSTGAKSGQRREVQLTYFHDGPDVILLASNYGGTKHPQWYYNLKAHPECEFGDRDFYRRRGHRS